MTWALVATTAQTLSYWTQPVLDSNGNIITASAWITSTVPVGTIINIINYDGISQYTPPAGSKLEQVPDAANIGDTGY